MVFSCKQINMAEADPDPLSLLRQYKIDKREIIEKDDEIILGKYCWPKNAKTNYLKKGSGKGETPKEYYTLECLVNFLKNVDLPHPKYVMQAEAEGIQFVRRPDRKDLLKYLSGVTTSCTNIDTSAPVILPQVKQDPDAPDVTTKTAGSKRELDEAETVDVDQKKQKLDNESEQQGVEEQESTKETES